MQWNHLVAERKGSEKRGQSEILLKEVHAVEREASPRKLEQL